MSICNSGFPIVYDKTIVGFFLKLLQIKQRLIFSKFIALLKIVNLKSSGCSERPNYAKIHHFKKICSSDIIFKPAANSSINYEITVMIKNALTY